MRESSFFHVFFYIYFLASKRDIGRIDITDYLHSLWSIGAFFLDTTNWQHILLITPIHVCKA